MSPARTVVFLGAGASQPLGFPLTSGILPAILQRLEARSLFERDSASRTKLETLLDGLLLPGLSTDWKASLPEPAKWEECLPWITDILSLTDHLLLHANAASRTLPPSELAEGRRLLERAIFEVLVPTYGADHVMDVPDQIRIELRTLSERGYSFGKRGDVPRILTDVAVWVERYNTEPGTVTLISTNYDVAVETELYRRMGYVSVFNDVDFGVSVREPAEGTICRQPRQPKLSIYKLHGSLNWVRCELCDHIYLNPLGEIAYVSFLPDGGDANTCHCGYSPLRHVMVAPSIVRDIRDPNLLQVWKSALEAMRSADEWIIVGYSMPPEDIAIRSMFIRAYTARRPETRPRITVVQNNKNSEPNYKLLFPNCTYKDCGFETFIAEHQPGAQVS